MREVPSRMMGSRPLLHASRRVWNAEIGVPVDNAAAPTAVRSLS